MPNGCLCGRNRLWTTAYTNARSRAGSPLGRLRRHPSTWSPDTCRALESVLVPAQWQNPLENRREVRQQCGHIRPRAFHGSGDRVRGAPARLAYRKPNKAWEELRHKDTRHPFVRDFLSNAWQIWLNAVQAVAGFHAGADRARPLSASLFINDLDLEEIHEVFQEGHRNAPIFVPRD